MKRIRFICTGNSARSIMAEVLMNHLGKGRYQAFSAGAAPTGIVNPLTLQTLEEQDRIEYCWHVDPVGPLGGDGSFVFGENVSYLSNRFRADYPGDVEIYYIILDTETLYESEPSPRKLLHIKPEIDITAPAWESKFTYSEVTLGALVIQAAATANPPSLEADIVWSIWDIAESDLTTDPSPAQGPGVTFTYTNLPSQNDQFGEKYIKASLPAYNVAESVLVKVFFLKYNNDNPGGVEPNWYYYWKQTSAAVGVHEYGGSECDGTRHGYYRFSEARFHICSIAAESDSILCAQSRWDGIDLFAATCRHEEQHRLDYFAWWYPIGGYIPNLHLDQDRDRCLDSIEPSLIPPLDPNLQNTYWYRYPGIPDFDDFEFRGYERECDWIPGAADDYDWANPGHQY